MDALRLLRRNPVLGCAAEPVLRTLAEASEVKVLDQGAIAVMAGAPQTHVLLIADGALELFRRNREDDTQFLVGVLSAPSIFGDVELYGRSGWAVSARANRLTVLLRMPNDAFDRMVSSDGRVAAGLYRESCQRHLLAVHIAGMMALQKTQHKILRLLWGLQDESAHGATPVSQAQLARTLGVNRKTIARNLRDLEALGMIERDKDAYRIVLPKEARFVADLGANHGFGASWRILKSEEIEGDPA